MSVRLSCLMSPFALSMAEAADRLSAVGKGGSLLTSMTLEGVQMHVISRLRATGTSMDMMTMMSLMILATMMKIWCRLLQKKSSKKHYKHKGRKTANKETVDSSQVDVEPHVYEGGFMEGDEETVQDVPVRAEEDPGRKHHKHWHRHHHRNKEAANEIEYYRPEYSEHYASSPLHHEYYDLMQKQDEASTNP